MKIKLYYMPGSRAQRVRWMLEELGLDYEMETVDLFKGEGNTPEYLAIHPLGQLPAIRINDEVMIESGAIVQWLAEIHPDKGLAPAIDKPARRKFDQWMYFAVATLEPPAWEIILHRDILSPEVAVKEIIPYATRRMQQALDTLEKTMTGCDYLVDDRFSAADIMMGYILMWFPEMLVSCPALQDYVARLQQRAAYQRSKEN